MKMKPACCALALIFAAIGGALAQTAAPAPAVNTVPVTADNFTRAESDLYFRSIAVKEGGFGKFFHKREPAPIDDQTVIRLNRDTLYSSAVFDLDAGPVTITLPDAGKRFMSMQVIDEDEYTHGVFYGAGSHTLTRQGIGTRYVAVAVRTLVDPADPKDVVEVHALQDAIKVSQKSPGKFEVPNWDPVSQKKVRDALLVLASTISDFRGAFGAQERGRSDPPSDRRRCRLGRQPRQGGDLSQRHAAEQRRQDDLSAHGQGRAGRRVLVGQRL